MDLSSRRMLSSTKTKRRNETAQIQKDMWDEMNNNDSSKEGSEFFQRANAQELGQRRIVQTSFVTPSLAAGGAAQLTGERGKVDSYAVSVVAKKNPFATVSLTAETKAPKATSSSTSSAVDGQIEEVSTKLGKDAQSLLKATDQVLMSIIRDPFSPAIFPIISTESASVNVNNAAASESKSIVPAQATSAFTGFTFQAPSTINYRDTTKQVPLVNSSRNSNQSFTFFPAPSMSTTNSDTAKEASKIVQEEVNVGEEDEEGFPKEEPEKALRESNEEEDTLYETRVKHYKLLPPNSQWKAFGAGVLRVMQAKGKDDDNRQRRRMVLRNEIIGSVLLNVAVVKGMKFTMEPQPKTNVGYIRFVNPADEQAIMLKVRGIDTLEKFHSLLTELAK